MEIIDRRETAPITRKHKVAIWAGCLIAVAILLGSIWALAQLPRSLGTLPIPADSYPVKIVDGPADLTGTWKSTDSVKSQFVAKVSGGQIDIQIVNDQGSLTYWIGSFENPQKNNDLISSKAVEGKLFWANATQKDFTYADGKISFLFMATGVSAEVELSRA